MLDSYYSPPPVHTTSMLLQPQGRRGDGPRTWWWRWSGGFILTTAKCAWVKMGGDNALAEVC